MKTTVYQLESIIPFGKQKGKNLEHVIINDGQYVKWCLLNMDHFDISMNAWAYFQETNPDLIDNELTAAWKNKESGLKAKLITFRISEIKDSKSEGVKFKNGNVQFFVETDQGKEITWWLSHWEKLEEKLIIDNKDGTARLAPGVRIGKDGYLYHPDM